MKRENTLDIAKGIVIILMVIGHCYSTQNEILYMIYAFHMPFFFIVSGLLYGKKCRNENYQFNPRKSIKKLLVPYFFYDGLFALFLVLLNHQQGLLQTTFDQMSKVITLRGATVTWYLPCILICEICFFMLYKLLREKMILQIAVLFLIGLLCPVKGYLEVVWRCFIAIGFFTYGFFVGGRDKKIMFDLSSKKKGVLYGIIFLVYAVLAVKNGLVSLVILQFGNPVLYVFNSILGTELLLVLAAWLDKRKVQGKLFVTFGKNTLMVLGTHMFLVEIIRLFDYKLCANLLKKLGLFEGIVFGIVVCSFEYIMILVYQKWKGKKNATNNCNCTCI